MLIYLALYSYVTVKLVVLKGNNAHKEDMVFMQKQFENPYTISKYITLK